MTRSNGSNDRGRLRSSAGEPRARNDTPMALNNTTLNSTRHSGLRPPHDQYQQQPTELTQPNQHRGAIIIITHLTACRAAAFVMMLLAGCRAPVCTIGRTRAGQGARPAEASRLPARGARCGAEMPVGCLIGGAQGAACRCGSAAFLFCFVGCYRATSSSKGRGGRERGVGTLPPLSDSFVA